jgi:transposase-like protein
MKTQKTEKAVKDEWIDELLGEGVRTADEVNGLLKRLTKAVLERALQGELTEHLG